MAVTAESVVVELLARTDGYTPKINAAAASSTQAMSKIERSASQAEAAVQRSSSGISSTVNKAANETNAAADRIAAKYARLSQQLAFSSADAASALQGVSAETDRTASATEKAANRAAYAGKNLGRQFSDIGASLASGGLAALPTVIAQQISQIVDAYSELSAASAEVKSAVGSAGTASGKAAGSFASLSTATASTKSATVQLAAADVAAVPATTALSTAARGEAAALATVTAGASAASAATLELTVAQRAAAFAAGPFGAALIAATTLGASLAFSMINSSESVSNLADQLEKNATKTRQTAEAQSIFEGTAVGAADAIDKMNEALGKANTTQERAIQLDLARAKSLREVIIKSLAAAEAAARSAVTEAKIAEGNTGIGLAGSADDQIALERDRDRAVAKRVASEEALKDAVEARVKAERAVVNASIPAIDGIAAAASDKAAAATRRHSLALQELRDAYAKASIAARNNGERERAVRAYREGRTRIDVSLAKEQDAIREADKKGPKGPSAATLAARAEAARVRDVRNNEAYNNELESLNQAIIQASRAQEVDAGKLAEYSRQEVASALAKRNAQITADEQAKRYTAAQADNLRKLAQEAAAAQNLNINSEEIRRRTDEQNAIARTRIDVEGDQLQAQLNISESLGERKALERKLLDLRFKQLRIEQDAILGDTTGRYTDAQRQQAAITRDALPGLQRASETAIDQRYRSPLERYRQSIQGPDSLQADLDAVKVDALEAVTDELTRATAAALGLKGAFGQVVAELIRIGIQRAVIGPLADSLFGKADGSSSGAIGSLISSVAGKFGRASGGYVGPGQTVRVNEGASRGPELLRMGAQGGTVIPLGQTRAAPRGAGTTIVHQSFNLDARYGITTPELLRYVNDTARAEGQRGGAAAVVANARSTPGTLAQYDKLEG